uniref:Ig-like domain-containing protein n=1 Tax=Oryzias latipes TaxID=8090 RepID=A0A3P9JZM5_ORYLA
MSIVSVLCFLLCAVAVPHNLLVLLCTGQAGAVTFHQSSPLIVKEKSEVHINCRHDDSSLVVMLWYQRSEDAAMTLIGYGYETIQNYEGQLEREFTLTRKGTVEGVLTVREASQKHSAVYFCAASTR